jgi:hypothetical protein
MHSRSLSIDCINLYNMAIYSQWDQQASQAHSFHKKTVYNRFETHFFASLVMASKRPMLIPKWGCLQRRCQQAFHRRNFWQHRRHLVVDEVKSRPIPASQGVLSAAKRWNFASCATVAGKAVLILEWIGLRENLHWKLSFSRLTPKYMSCIFPSFNSWNYVDIAWHNYGKAKRESHHFKKKSWYFSLLHMSSNCQWEDQCVMGPSVKDQSICSPEKNMCYFWAQTWGLSMCFSIFIRYTHLYSLYIRIYIYIYSHTYNII